MSTIKLAPEVEKDLKRICHAHPKPYMRERAAAILKIAAGMPPFRVARVGLLEPRDPDTVYGWRDRFLAEGVDGLGIRPGRGRKPARGDRTPEEATAEVLDVVRRDPYQLGFTRARWRLEDIRDACAPWMGDLSLSGVWRILDRLRISYQRGRDHVHSPDPDYLEKREYIAARIEEARASEGLIVFLYMDEASIYRQPTLSRAYEARGEAQPRAERSHASDTVTRVAGTLNVFTGQVDAWMGSRFGVDAHVAFYQQVCRAYPGVNRIYMGQDNWPMHYHPDVLVALEPQEHPWPMRTPGHWPTEPGEEAIRKWGSLKLPIQLVPLPTYASWLNPIEKLWRKLRQEQLHLHRLADQLAELHRRVRAFLDQFSCGSAALLRYVGLAG